MAGKRQHRKETTRNSVTAAVCLTLFLFALSVLLVLNARWLYYMDITLLGLELQSGMDSAAIKLNYDALISYNQLFYRGALVFPSLPMSREGATHFQEVKRIFDGIWLLCIGSGLLFVVFGIRARRRRRRFLRLTGILTLLVPLALGILVAAGWERFFIAFHHLFFRNDYWLFDPVTDPVIRILPDAYFLHCAIGILALILFESALCFVLSRRRT